MNLRFSGEQSPATLTDTDTDVVVSRIDFRTDGDTFFLDYLWTNPEFRGQGHAREMVDHFSAFVQTRGGRITPICGVARAMMQGDARYTDVLHVGLRPR
ncbi:N-acetyltransferase [Lujinxingia vulgaris]|uniref:N-acetyltransferase n=2 Tax=Lujinxingia vulgaris TaxID=2600176 RepID=A0A5C6XAY4_9DELT|nr:GNAT family N-acetyltransferase [Lujinxingia vulgaris]TXD36856.1 N-acetyltransferase [Lujinxingia vulgaris]